MSDDDPIIVGYHVTLFGKVGHDHDDETVIEIPPSLPPQCSSLRWAAERAGTAHEAFLDFLEEEKPVEVSGGPEHPVRWKPRQGPHDFTAFGPAFLWGPLRLRAIRAGVPVVHPSHYNSHPSGVETIDCIEHLSFNLASALRYLWRQDHKHASPADDLNKAKWYLAREVTRLQRPIEDNDTGHGMFRRQLILAAPWAQRVVLAEPSGTVLSNVLKALFDPKNFDFDHLSVNPAQIAIEALLAAEGRPAIAALPAGSSAETLPAPAEDLCEKCSQGTLRMLSGPGRMFPTANEEDAFEIPEHLAILTCDHCGAQLLNAATIDVLTDAETKHRFPGDHDSNHVSTCGICKGAGWKNLSLTLAEVEYAAQWKNRWPYDRSWGKLSRAERAHFRIASENERERQAQIANVSGRADLDCFPDPPRQHIEFSPAPAASREKLANDKMDENENKK